MNAFTFTSWNTVTAEREMAVQLYPVSVQWVLETRSIPHSLNSPLSYTRTIRAQPCARGMLMRRTTKVSFVPLMLLHVGGSASPGHSRAGPVTSQVTRVTKSPRVTQLRNITSIGNFMFPVPDHLSALLLFQTNSFSHSLPDPCTQCGCVPSRGLGRAC